MCPGLIVLPSDHLFYQMLSANLKPILKLKFLYLSNTALMSSLEMWADGLKIVIH